MTLFMWMTSARRDPTQGMLYWLFLYFPRAWVLPCACTCSASHAVVKQHRSDLRACSWEQNKLFLGFGLLQFTFVVKIRRGGKKCTCQQRDEGASSQPKMGTLSVFINIGVFLLNVMFPSNMCCFFLRKVIFRLQYVGSHCLYCLGSMEKFF